MSEQLTHGIYRELKEKFKNEIRYASYEDMLTTQIASMFDYEDCETIDTRFIELYLLTLGCCAIWKLEHKLIVSACYRAGKPNANGLGSDLICVTGNGVAVTFRDFETNNEVAYIRNNKYATPDLNIERFASVFTELSKSVVHNIINSRYTPIIVARDMQAKIGIETALKENNSGSIQVVLSDNIFDTEKENVLNVTDVNAQDKIQYLNHAYDDLLRQFYNQYGLDTCGNSKQAQQTVEEINAGCNARLVLPNNRLQERKAGLERANEIFGTEMKVDFSEAWKREFEKPRFVDETRENEFEYEIDGEDGGEEDGTI